MNKKKQFTKIAALSCVAALSAACSKPVIKNQDAYPPAPTAEKIAHKLTKHGQTRIDNYYWLNQRNNAKVINYIEAENQYTNTVMKETEPLQNTLFKEMKSRIVQDDSTVPYFDNGFWYYTRYEKGKEYPIYCRKEKELTSPEIILLNVNELAKGHDYFRVGSLDITPDNKIMAYSADTQGRRIYKVFFKDLETGNLIDQELPVAQNHALTSNFEWAGDSQTIFYVTKDTTTLRPSSVRKYNISNKKSERVYFEKDAGFYTYISKSKTKKYIFINTGSTLSTEVWYIDAAAPSKKPVVFSQRKKELEYSIEDGGNIWFVHTNLKAKNFRIMSSDKKDTSSSKWREVVAHRSNVLIEGFEVFKNYIVLQQRNNGLTELEKIHRSAGKRELIKFPEPVYTTYIGTNPNYDSATLRYGYQSLTTPASVYDYNLETGEATLMKQQKVLGGFKPSNYKAERLFAKASDGTMVPVSLVYRTDKFKQNGGSPLLITGYGSYGYSNDVYFSTARLSLLDRGFAIAIAHIRGGSEMGRQWYEDGKFLKKKNTFTDFVAASKHLIDEKYTSPGHLYASGGSAGGLLMGAIINSNPELYHGVIAQVPFVDVVTTMLDDSVPLTTGEYEEWGNPNDKKYYTYMLSYSPYDNVKKQNYPNLLITSGLSDSQVQYWEPTKWTAKLREYKTDNNILILKTNMSAGHSGKSGRFEQLKETAFEYAFLIALENKNKQDK